MKYVIDSSGWLDFFTEGQHAAVYGRYMKNIEQLATPTVVLYEVYRKIKREKTEEDALRAISLMNRTSVIDLTESIALFAADLGLKYSLPMADAMVYATALEKKCTIVTGDAHFSRLDQVMFVE